MEIRAPLSGFVVPLSEVPDPVFAGGLAGEGVAIEPTSDEVVSPLAGRVTGLHRARHAITVTAENGLAILVHVGLDTVGLEGRGFTPLVGIGDEVACGQPLLRFDADLVARSARSLLTEVVVANGDDLRTRVEPGPDAVRVEAGRSVLFVAEVLGTAPQAESVGGTTVRSEPIPLPNHAGLHARPAAVLGEAARRFSAEIRLLHGDRSANARSVVGILGLSTRHGDTVEVEATGPDAPAAVEALRALLLAGSGESIAAPPPTPAPEQPIAAAAAGEGELGGVPASPGIAVGQVVQHRRTEIFVAERGGAHVEERARFLAALASVGSQLDALRQRESDASRAGILAAHRALLDDPELQAVVEAHLLAGKSAALAWKAAFTAQAQQLESLEVALLRERAADVRDVGRRVLAVLAGVGTTQLSVPAGSILVAEELTPSETAALDPARIAGFCTTGGGPTGHVAIVARSLGIPAVCGMDPAVLHLADGERAILDGTAGILRISPDEEALALASARLAAEAALREAERDAAHRPAITRDGARRIEVAANIRSLEDAQAAVAAGAEGVGLLRSEFLFADRQQPPDEEEQARAYVAIAEAIGPDHRLVVRTLDVGGDKALPYLPIPPEENPFLGLRGIRVSLAHPELFRTQVRAILRAAPATQLHLMFPMIADLEELRAACRLLAQERNGGAVQIGVMVEVPAAAILAETIAREVDFLSIGTNDLTQYTLAMDRGHPRLARQVDALHPAVLRMIEQTVAGARRHGKWVGVCGGIASDSLAVPVLVGLGVDELSVSVPSIGAVKAAVGRWSLDECERIAAGALACGTAAEVHALLARAEEMRDGQQPLALAL